MRVIRLLVSLSALIICSTAAYAHGPTFSAWDGPADRVGQGGTKETVDGIDLWTMGDPPGHYHIVGLITREHGGDGIGKKSRMAHLIKDHGGDAGIVLATDTVNNGGFAITPTIIAAVKKTTVRVLVIKYDAP